ncbi:MAG: baseplate J/gp47 family protein [Proteobacteria bacterium]|nr:baseplate J/gp47 family protein [Pseudomonadota bacterium]
MSFTPRIYEEIVRDLLTTMTGGTVRETLSVEAGVKDAIVLRKLSKRPVRRISHIEEIRRDPEGKETKIRYTPNDYELIASGNDGPDSIRFRKDSNMPLIGSTLVVNYYPVETEPTPLTDVTVGSVARTMMETFGRELATTEQQLDFVYKSAYLETATNNALDKVVALVGVKRMPAGHPVVSLKFSRIPQTAGRITIPVDTVVSDGNNNRYLTLGSLILEPYEQSREVLAGGEGPGTKEVEENTLTRLEVLIAGIGEVTNPKPARRMSVRESDEDLRKRTSGALHGVLHGTLDAIKFGLLSIEGVQSVSITEFPNDIPGELKVEIAYSNKTDDVFEEVQQRLKELRPAGVRIIQGVALHKSVSVSISLTLAGRGLPEEETELLKNEITQKIKDHLSAIPAGGSVRQAKLGAIVLENPAVVDCAVSLICEGSSPADSLTLATNEIIEVKEPFEFPLIQPEDATAPVAQTITVSAFLPVYLEPAVTQQEVDESITMAFDGFLATRSPQVPLTVDAMAAAIRDDSRFVLVRDEALITVEVEESFFQLSDGLGEYVPGIDDVFQSDEITIEVREG